MGLKDWFSRNIMDIGGSGGAGDPTPTGSRPSASPGRPLPVIRSSTRTVGDLAADLPPRPTFEGKVPPPSEAPIIAAEDVYRSAGVKAPAHGYTVEKVGGMLDNERLASMTRQERATAVMVALEAAGVSVEEIIRDAVAKDRALDAFEDFRAKQVKAMRDELDMENIELQVAIDAFVKEKTAQIEGNRQKAREAESELETWRLGKMQIERKLAEVVEHFTGENPVTVSGPPKPAASSLPVSPIGGERRDEGATPAKVEDEATSVAETESEGRELVSDELSLRELKARSAQPEPHED